MVRLPRCRHGSALLDWGGNRLEPDCGCRSAPAAPAQIITHPSAVMATLARSLDLDRCEARIETLQNRQRELAHKIGALLTRTPEVRLNTDTAAGWGRQLADAYEELRALGAEEE